MTSFELWHLLTSSFGWTAAPSRLPARCATTSFMFVLVDVPEPVWYTSIGNCSSHRPSATSRAATAIACALLGVEQAEGRRSSRPRPA